MYIKIYFGDKPVFLCEEIEVALQEYMHHPDNTFMDEVSGPAIKSFLHEMAKPEIHSGIIRHKDLAVLRKAFWKQFALVKAAGGLIENEATDILLIFRRGKWDLPKGKLDPGETLEQCAVREVQEETGLQHIVLGEFLLVTYHAYNDYGHAVLKESHWYRMQSPASDTLIPQTSEDIHDIKWVAKTALLPYLSNTFSSIKDVLDVVKL